MINTESRITTIIEDNMKKFKEVEYKITSSIAVFGAGQYGVFCSEYLQQQGYKVIALIDNDREKVGNQINGIPVVAPQDPIIAQCDVIFIGTRRYAQEILHNYDFGISCMSFNTWFIIKNQEKYERLLSEDFCDEKSKYVLRQMMLAMLSNDEKHLGEVKEDNQYFCLPEFLNNFHENLVDVGAFVGDSLESFLWKYSGAFSSIYAFEPGKEAFKGLKTRSKRLIKEWALDKSSIKLVNAGVGETDKVLYFEKKDKSNKSFAFTALNKGEKVKICTIDSFDFGKNVPTVIKADIEGMEIGLLKGAEKTIKNHKPKLAMCVYHRPQDLFEIIDYIKNIVPEYKMSLRHHSFFFEETVLYCY